MHTLYMTYDGNGNVTNFVIDNASTSQNFIPLDRGPLSYIQSIIDNLSAYIKKNGSLKVDNAYIGQIRHGQFDESYGTIENKRTEDSNYTFKSVTPTSTAAPASSASSSAPVASSAATQDPASQPAKSTSSK